MKSDIKGVSQCQHGQENYKTFYYNKGIFYQYDYRTQKGELFSCVAPTLEKCRNKRDRWFEEQKEN